MHSYTNKHLPLISDYSSQKWSHLINDVKSHINKWESGEDYNDENQLLLIKAIENLDKLVAFYKIYPQGDDRQHSYLQKRKIGLDIDELIADWVGHWTKYHGQVTPEFWNFDRNIQKKFEELKDNKEFWLSIPPKIDPKTLPFEPHCYVTSRIIPTEWTEEWIQNWGFPTTPVYTVPHNASKVQVLKELGVDIFVDDRYENFVDLNQNGICCYLFDAPHNKRYNVGYKRIYSLNELI